MNEDELKCDVINKVGRLNSIELFNEVDRIDAIEDLLNSYNSLQEYCSKEKACKNNCGKKLPGIERA